MPKPEEGDRVEEDPLGKDPSEKEFEEGWDEAAKDEGGEEKKPVEVEKDGKDEHETEHETEHDKAVEVSEVKDRSDKHGKVASMEKSVEDTRRYAMQLKSERDKFEAENQKLKDNLSARERGEATDDDVKNARKSVAESRDRVSDTLEKVGEDYPELMEAFNSIHDSTKLMEEKISSLEAQSRQDRERDKEEARRREQFDSFNQSTKPKILKAHPDYDSIVFVKQDGKLLPNEEFFRWADGQTTALRAAALESPDAEDIIWAITAFKKAHASGEIEAAKKAQDEERNEKITNAQTLRGGTTDSAIRKTSPDMDDYGAGWNEAKEIIAKENG